MAGENERPPSTTVQVLHALHQTVQTQGDTLARSLLRDALALLACAEADHRACRRRWEPMGRVVYWTRAKIIDVLADFLACEGRLPLSREWHNAMAMGLPARQTVMRHFGSIEALRQAMQEVEESAERKNGKEPS